jgi:hypothetical protein
MSGVRYLDIRCCEYVRPKQNKIEYWCGHTFMSVPLDLVLGHIIKFLRQHPTEVLVLAIRPDWSPINSDYLGLARRKHS